MTPKQTMSVSLDPGLIARVRALAGAERLPISWLVSDLLTLGLERHSKGQRSRGSSATHVELFSVGRKPTKGQDAEVLP